VKCINRWFWIRQHCVTTKQAERDNFSIPRSILLVDFVI